MEMEGPCLLTGAQLTIDKLAPAILMQ